MGENYVNHFQVWPMKSSSLLYHSFVPQLGVNSQGDSRGLRFQDEERTIHVGMSITENHSYPPFPPLMPTGLKLSSNKHLLCKTTENLGFLFVCLLIVQGITLMQKLLLGEGCYCNKNPKFLALVHHTVKMETNIQGYKTGDFCMQ